MHVLALMVMQGSASQQCTFRHYVWLLIIELALNLHPVAPVQSDSVPLFLIFKHTHKCPITLTVQEPTTVWPVLVQFNHSRHTGPIGVVFSKGPEV